MAWGRLRGAALPQIVPLCAYDSNPTYRKRQPACMDACGKPGTGRAPRAQSPTEIQALGSGVGQTLLAPLQPSERRQGQPGEFRETQWQLPQTRTQTRIRLFCTGRSRSPKAQHTGPNTGRGVGVRVGASLQRPLAPPPYCGRRNPFPARPAASAFPASPSAFSSGCRLQTADWGAASCDWQCVFVQQPAPEPWISGVARRLALARNTLYVCGNARIYPGRPPAVTFIVAGGCVWGRAQRAVRDCSLRPAVRN